MIDTPEITQTQARHTAVIHLNIPREEVRHVMRPGLEKLTAAVAAQSVAPAGPWFNRHLRTSPTRFDFEISVPVSAPVAAVGRVKPGLLPAATVARTVYRGPYEGLGTAWAEFDRWVRESGHTPADELWECYVAGPETGPDPSAWRTELNRPLLD